MEWLIGITGRHKIPSASGGGPPRKSEVIQSPYMVKTLMGKMTKDDLKETVQIPTGIDPNEWLATNTMSFFNHIIMIRDSLQDFCTTNNCSATTSNGPPMIWHDKGKKVRLAAPEYIDLVVVQIQKYITDESVFPTKYDMTFPTNFQSVIKKIFRLLFQVLAHVYQCHYQDMDVLQQTNVLNTVFIHFMYFQTEHCLLEQKEISQFDDLIKSLCL